MKKYIGILFAIAVLSITTSLKAASDEIQLGYTDQISIDHTFSGWPQYEITLYCDGVAVAIYDTYGVLYTAPGVTCTATVSGNRYLDYYVQGAWGNWSAVMKVSGDQYEGSYSYWLYGSPYSITYNSSYNGYVGASFNTYN